jgi:hypothetical protein
VTSLGLLHNVANLLIPEGCNRVMQPPLESLQFILLLAEGSWSSSSQRQTLPFLGLTAKMYIKNSKQTNQKFGHKYFPGHFGWSFWPPVLTPLPPCPANANAPSVVPICLARSVLTFAQPLSTSPAPVISHGYEKTAQVDPQPLCSFSRSGGVPVGLPIKDEVLGQCGRDLAW